ncbi:MAG: peptidylprolyl isomerase [Deltaproteobacteria bacterium]|nr:peptidylprolyl isomerase [Deltaproteobacteria bacterium]
MKIRLAALLLPAACLAAACNKAPDREANKTLGMVPVPAGQPPPATPERPLPPDDFVSKGVLERPAGPGPALIKHVLLSWKDLAPAYMNQQDPRGAARTQKEAGRLARELADKIRTGGSIDDLIKEYSEDRGGGGEPYEIRADRDFVPEFKDMALRLAPKEVGIARTKYGYHVMFHVPPAPPDPLESADILARDAPPASDGAWARHILIGWRDLQLPGHRPLKPAAQARSKADADKLVTSLLERLRGGEAIEPMMAELSEDDGSAKTGRAYEIKADAPMVEPFKNLARRLKVGEAGLVRTQFGWHVILRVPPPPPDPAESADILAREVVATDVQVKHILISWKDLAAAFGGQQDPRAAARTRPDADKLVATLVARLKKGDKIEPLMKEFSEDPGSAAAGNSYPVNPSAGLVEPFKNLSLRLKLNEIGVVKTDFGLHIIQRVQ